MRLRYFRDIELDFNFLHCVPIFRWYFSGITLCSVSERTRVRGKKFIHVRFRCEYIKFRLLSTSLPFVYVFFLSLSKPFELQSSCVVCILIKLHAERAMRARWLALLPFRIFSRRPNHNFIFHFSMSAFICSFIPHREWYTHDTKAKRRPGQRNHQGVRWKHESLGHLRVWKMKLWVLQQHTPSASHQFVMESQSQRLRFSAVEFWFLILFPLVLTETTKHTLLRMCHKGRRHLPWEKTVWKMMIKVKSLWDVVKLTFYFSVVFREIMKKFPIASESCQQAEASQSLLLIHAPSQDTNKYIRINIKSWAKAKAKVV